MQQTEIFPPKHIAMELQAKGFDWDCLGFYSNRHDEVRFKSYGVLMEEQLYGAPTYDQVVGWFASKGIDVDICANSNPIGYKATVFDNTDDIRFQTGWQDNRQQSLLTAFEEALKLI